MLPLWTAVLPNAVHGAVQLILYEEALCAADIVLLVIVIGVQLLAGFVCFGMGVSRISQQFYVVRKQIQLPVGKWLQDAVHAILARRWQWESHSPHTSPLYNHGKLLVLQYRVLWFSVLDAAMLAILSVLSSLAVEQSMVVCQALVGSIVALMFVHVLICTIVRPFTTLFDHVMTLLTLVTNAIVATLQLVLLNDLSNASILAGAATCELLLLGVVGAKAVMDVIAFATAIKRRCRRLVCVHEVVVEPQLVQEMLDWVDDLHEVDQVIPTDDSMMVATCCVETISAIEMCNTVDNEDLLHKFMYESDAPLSTDLADNSVVTGEFRSALELAYAVQSELEKE